MNGEQRGKRYICWLEKSCRGCGQIKALAEFAKNSGHFDGRANHCLTCRPNKPGGRESPEKLAARWAKYARRESYQARKRERRRHLRETVAGRLNHRMSRGVWESLKHGKTGRSWRELVGYDVEELRAHLEARFLPGMTWENMGEWHIDHVRPLASFSFSGPADDDFRAAWALTNLQPLWAIDNLRKGARYAGPALDTQRACS